MAPFDSQKLISRLKYLGQKNSPCIIIMNNDYRYYLIMLRPQNIYFEIWAPDMGPRVVLPFGFWVKIGSRVAAQTMQVQNRFLKNTITIGFVWEVPPKVSLSLVFKISM